MPVIGNPIIPASHGLQWTPRNGSQPLALEEFNNMMTQLAAIDAAVGRR
jgi:hypothetical protein